MSTTVAVKAMPWYVEVTLLKKGLLKKSVYDSFEGIILKIHHIHLHANTHCFHIHHWPTLVLTWRRLSRVEMKVL